MDCSPPGSGPLPTGLSRRECWRGKPFSPPGDLPDPWIEARSALEEDSSPSEPPLPTVLTSVPAVDMGDQEMESFKKNFLFYIKVQLTFNVVLPPVTGN